MRMIRFGLVLVGDLGHCLRRPAGLRRSAAKTRRFRNRNGSACRRLFLGRDAVYKHVQGVSNVVSGGVPHSVSIFLPENFVNPVLDYDWVRVRPVRCDGHPTYFHRRSGA